MCVPYMPAERGAKSAPYIDRNVCCIHAYTMYIHSVQSKKLNSPRISEIHSYKAGFGSCIEKHIQQTYFVYEILQTIQVTHCVPGESNIKDGKIQATT